MTAIMVKLLLVLSLVLIISALCHRNAAAYTPADNHLIDCGSDVDTPVRRRVFVSDNSGPVTLTAHHSAAVKASPGSVPADFDGAAVYLTARVFTVPSSYSFTISRRGPHFIRLHFFPFTSDGYDLAAARFKVSTQDAVLVDSFTPAKNNASCDEFLLRVDRDTLVITFVPLAGHVAFVNAVEVVSAPDDLFTGRAVEVEAMGQTLGQRVNPASALPLQTAFRVNVGGPAVAANGDALWREWATDQRFLIGSVGTREVAYNESGLNRLPGEATSDDAPDAVYATARQMEGSNWVDTSKQMMWQFDVRGGGQQPPSSPSYLVRLHFCDIVSTAPHLLLIDVYLNYYAVVTGLDLSTIGSGVLAFPYFMDFVLDSSDRAGKISITIGSSSTMKKNSALPGPILNGIEIMRMNFSSGSPVVVDPATRSKKQQLGIVVGSLCGAFAVVSVAAVLVIVLNRRKKKEKTLPTRSPQSSPPSTPWMPLLNRFSFSSGRQSTSRAGSSPGSFTIPGSSNTPGSSSRITAAQASVPSYRVPFATLQAATNNFDEGLVIGAGGFGTVYRAVLPDGTTVAAKRASPESRQGAREFRNEIETLSGLRHRHLVSLVGYCDDADEMVLLYEYMAQGSLRSRLHELSWAQRLEALVGAAQGLLYLHTALAQPVIHRDVKSSNILLDAGGAAKVADLGLSRAGPGPEESHVSTAVKGSFGYVDPEYARTRRLTRKSDVYSFGVVMLEALCGRPVVNPRMVNLVEWWGQHWRRSGGEVDKVVVDRRVAAEVRPAALRKYGETVYKCLAERGADRPAMEDVLWSLKFVVRLQDDGNALEFSDVDSFVVNGLTPPSDPTPLPRSSPGSEDGGEVGDDLTDGNYTDVSMGGIFRQMIDVRGR